MNFDKLNDYSRVLRDHYGIPAFDIAVSVDGKEVYRNIEGWSDSEKTVPASDRDVYMCYSTSKVMTGAALAKLVSEGVLSLDDEAAKYIPEFADAVVGIRNEKGEVVDTRPIANPVLLRHLGSMAGGLSYNIFSQYIHKPLEKKSLTARELAPLFLKDTLLFDPGTDYAYSLGLDALGGIIEVVTGMRFGEYMKKNFFDPLGMTMTTYHATEEQSRHMTAQYNMKGRDENGKYIYEPVEKHNGFVFCDTFDSGGAGVYTTVNDYLRFAEALANGGVGRNGARVMKPEAIELMRTPMLSEKQKKTYDTLGKVGTSYGLGVFTTLDAEKFGFRLPVGEFGWDGAAAATVSIYPEKKTCMYFGIQVLGFGEAYSDIHPKLRELVYEAVGF